MESPRVPFPAAVLAGGKSRRMGSDKFLLPLGGEPAIRRVVRLLEGVFSRVFVVANEDAPFRKLGLQVEKDLLPGNNSLGGLHAAIVHAGAPHVFVAGCDMPFLRVPLLRGLALRATEADVIVPIRDGFPEPLCAVYGRSCEAVIKRRIESGKLKVVGFHEEVRTLRVEETEWRTWDPEGFSFRNLNTPEDYEWALAEMAGEKEGRDAG